MCMKLIFSESPRHGGHFEYPCYGFLTHRKFLESFEFQKIPQKWHFFAFLAMGTPMKFSRKMRFFHFFLLSDHFRGFVLTQNV